MGPSEADKQIRHLRALGALSVAVPVAVVALFGLYRFDQATQEARLQVERSSRVATENATKVLVSAESAARRARALVRGKGASEILSAQARLRDELADIAKDQGQLLSIIVAGPDGQVLASSRAGQLPAPPVGGREFFKAHQGRVGDEPRLADPLSPNGFGERALDLSLAFEGPDGGFGGVVDVSTRASYFQDFYSDLASGQPGLALAAFSADGALYARWPPVAGVDRLDPDSPIMRQIAGGAQSGTMRSVSPVDKQDKVMRWQRAGRYPLYTAAGVSFDQARAALLKDLAVLLALGLPASGALWFAIHAAIKRARESAEANRLLEEETAARKRAEETLAAAQRLEALGRVAGGVAHEFNNALMVMGANAKLILRSPPETIPKRAQSIGRAVEAASKLTRQLLSFTRRQALSPERVDLREFLPGAAALLGPTLGSQIALSIEVDPGAPPVFVDVAELELALVNLAINAKDAQPAGGSFRLRARPAAGGARVEIVASDDGPGIDPSIAERVFDPFFTTKAVGQGAGLGLSQVHGMCARAGGEVRLVASQAGGASIAMLLPAASASEESPMGGAPAAAFRGGRVLLLEDDPAVAEATGELLAELGCEAEWAERGPEALRRLDAAGADLPDFVVSDVRMPGEFDGLEFARRVRLRWPGLPVLLVTGYAEGMADIEREGFAALAKPFTVEALGVAMARVAGMASPSAAA